MSVQTVTESMTDSRYLNGQAIVYCKLPDGVYVIAKSVVKALTDTAYLCGENPYINQILLQLPTDTQMLPVTGEALLAKVWDTPGHSKDVVFVKAETLVNHLEHIFSDIAPAQLAAVRQTLRENLAELA